eukprot:Filipodium_phascolosomae@DN2705_c0_g3_i2.p1
MNPIRTKVVAVLLMCMIANHALVEGQDNFLDRPNVDSVDSAGLRRLVVFTSAAITNKVKAGETSAAKKVVNLAFQITAPPATNIKLLVQAPEGFQFPAAGVDCLVTGPVGATCVISGGKAEWEFASKLAASTTVNLSTKLMTVPSWADRGAKFVVTYDGVSKNFHIDDFLQSVKGGMTAANVGGDASFAIMQPVNHT